jgi:hypothetical protein
MRQPWTWARCDQPILKGQPFTTAIVPGRSPHPGVVSGKVLVHKNEEDCKTLDGAVRRMRWSWTVTTPSVTAAPDGPGG